MKGETMDLDVNRIRDLLDQREKIDQELAGIFGSVKERKPIKCGKCGEEGHSARSCTKE